MNKYRKVKDYVDFESEKKVLGDSKKVPFLPDNFPFVRF